MTKKHFELAAEMLANEYAEGNDAANDIYDFLVKFFDRGNALFNAELFEKRVEQLVKKIITEQNNDL